MLKFWARFWLVLMFNVEFMFRGMFKLLVKFWGRFCCKFMFSCRLCGRFCVRFCVGFCARFCVRFCARFCDASCDVLKFNSELTGIPIFVMLDVKLGCEFVGTGWCNGRFWLTFWFMRDWLLIFAFFGTMNPFSSGVKEREVPVKESIILTTVVCVCVLFLNENIQFCSVPFRAFLQRAIWGLFKFVLFPVLIEQNILVPTNSLFQVQFASAILQNSNL